MYPWGSDHRFEGNEQAQYDSLRDRRYYDDLRWNEGLTHDQAFQRALEASGQNYYYLEYVLPEQGYNVKDLDSNPA